MDNTQKDGQYQPGFTDQVGRHEARKLKAQRQRRKPLWLGFSITGLVGWGVVIPSLAGLALGMWIDARVTSFRSWTLMLFSFGLVVGCFNAWYWIRREMDAIRRDEEETANSNRGEKHD